MKLLWSVLAVSTLGTTLSSSLQLLLEYRDETSALEDALSGFEKAGLESIRNLVWTYDEAGLTRVVDSALAMKELINVSVLDDAEKTLLARSKSDMNPQRQVKRTYPLISEEGQRIGSVKVVFTTDFIFERLRSRLLSIVIFNFGKTTLVSIFLLWIFSRLAVRPVEEAARHFRDNISGKFGRTLQLKPNIFRKWPDELDELADGVNRYEENLRELFVQNRQLIEQQRGTIEAQSREIQEEQARGLELARIAEIGVMTGGIAHEINNPLAIVVGQVRSIRTRLEKGECGPDELQKRFESIESSAGRIVKIIKGLQSFGRDGERDPCVDVALADVLNEVRELVADPLKVRGVKFEVMDVPLSLKLQCRKVEITQILVNLIINGADACQVMPDRWVRVDCEESGAGVVIKVTDSGKGIDPEVAAKMFLPFYTTKDVGKGTGLGLFLVHNIVRGHQGKIWVEGSSPNTQFVISLPKQQTRETKT